MKITTPNDSEISIERAFAAPRATVFEAFTVPTLIQRWLLGPDGWHMPVCDVDLRPGGTFRYRWRSDDGSKEFGVHGEYRETVPPERIVHVERFDDEWYAGDAHVTTAFSARDGGTQLVMTIRFASKAVRDRALESGMTDGIAASYDRLEATVLADALSES